MFVKIQINAYAIGNVRNQSIREMPSQSPECPNREADNLINVG
jgi:hypothetical protein